MTSPHDHDALDVKQYWVDENGSLNFLVTSFDDPWGTVELSPDGSWSAGYADLSTPDTVDAQAMISLCSRHIIDRAFGGKTS